MVLAEYDKDEQGRRHLPARARALATGRIVSSATRRARARPASGRCALEIKGGDGIDTFNAIAAQCYAKAETCPTGQLAIVLDSRVVSAPTIQQPSFERDQIQITGSFTESEAKDLALVLRYGSLPVNLEPQTVQTVSATLGEDSLQAGPHRRPRRPRPRVPLHARVLPGPRPGGGPRPHRLERASTTRSSAGSGETQGLALSLAGVTGLVVSVGVTVDSYVVYFERLKDEVRLGPHAARPPPSGLFKRAFRTIIAANVSSLIGAVLLYVLTVGPVRGFAFFLGLATCLDVVVAWFFIRPMVGLLGRSKLFTEHQVVRRGPGPRGRKASHTADPPWEVAVTRPVAQRRAPSIWTRLYHGETTYDFVGRFRSGSIISADRDRRRAGLVRAPAA